MIGGSIWTYDMTKGRFIIYQMEGRHITGGGPNWTTREEGASQIGRPTKGGGRAKLEGGKKYLTTH